MLIHVNAPHFCAGIVARDGKCVMAAPVLKWCKGKDINWLLQYFERKGWDCMTGADGTEPIEGYQSQEAKYTVTRPELKKWLSACVPHWPDAAARDAYIERKIDELLNKEEEEDQSE